MNEHFQRVNLTKHHLILITINSLLILTFPLIHLIFKQTPSSPIDNNGRNVSIAGNCKFRDFFFYRNSSYKKRKSIWWIRW